MESALLDYKHYIKVLSSCKLGCQRETQLKQSVVKHIQEMMPFEKLIQETLCVMKCKEKKFSENRDEYSSEVTRNDFEKKKPYDYLQICYFQTGRLQEAANAAYTHHIYNQDYKQMKENLDYYKNLPEVDGNKIEDKEEENYVKSYLEGTENYRNKDWNGMIQKMEQALKEYFESEEICRINCDKPFDMGWYPDFKSSVANHFTFCLKCKMNCAQLLNNFRGEFMENLVPTFYHYLQFGYYNLGNMTEAARCASTYLHLVPSSVEMKNNVDYYRIEEKVDEKWFQPRQEAVNYVHRDNDEESLLTFIENNFIFNKNSEQDKVSSQEKDNLEKDEFYAQWSDEKENYVLEEKQDSRPISGPEIQGPPVVKFSW